MLRDREDDRRGGSLRIFSYTSIALLAVKGVEPVTYNTCQVRIVKKGQNYDSLFERYVVRVRDGG